MTKGLGIKFRKFNNISPLKGYKEDSLKVGSAVIVETERGVEYGWIVKTSGGRPRKTGFTIKLRKISRYADQKDTSMLGNIEKKEKDAQCTACAKIREYDLPIKMICAEVLFDESRAVFYFKIADGKKTFSSRELIKDLSASLGMKIEMHQLNARDEASLYSGIGICGRPLCCSTFLEEFPHVTVKMLKEQGIPMNQSKVCGICGKLMCCLKYEYEGKAKK